MGIPQQIYTMAQGVFVTREMSALPEFHITGLSFGKGLFGHGSLLLFSDLRAFCQRYGGGKII